MPGAIVVRNAKGNLAPVPIELQLDIVQMRLKPVLLNDEHL